MGLLTDFFVADPAELSDNVLNDGPPDGRLVLRASAVDPVKLATLEALIRGMDLSDTEAVVDLCPVPVRDGGEDGPWILELKPEFISLLAGLTPDKQMSIADAWARTEEWAFDGADANFQGFFRALCEFAGAATQKGGTTYLWMSL